ncbi:hypothetical protein HPP92_010972 [Vanilla planifolia]|uniref:Bromo domain-containing protein n=1 Tax=Vanilla planifolia TaxID=51239 RepID=A0A835V319_VANPL|nr:hypothetical protein HPP92_010972 [Vanilla planifolia]
MKRKRGSRGPSKKVKRNDISIGNNPISPTISNEEDTVGQNGEDHAKYELDFEHPTIVYSKSAKVPSSNTDVANTKSTPTMKSGHSRVKVKLKSSKLDPYRSSSDVQMPSVHTPNDSDMGKPQSVMDMNEATSRKADIADQTLETSNAIPESHRKKPGSIKIKSTMCSGFSDDSIKEKKYNKLSTPDRQEDRIIAASAKGKISDLSPTRRLQPMGTKMPQGDLGHNMELSASLSVIRKVMKMDAAEPFNSPVNPVALGIPDYFEIIDTPMDFGSICRDLEHGNKYIDSLDVYKDVQFIWDNCYKYNNKGDYVLELMKRVKKNFMKYWSAAGLQTVVFGGKYGKIQGDDSLHHKSTSKIKSKHKRRRHGIDGHKSNCLCAVCVVRRRRKEREEHSAVVESNTSVGHASFPDDSKLEVSSTDNLGSEGTSSSLNRSPETYADAKMDESENVERVETIEVTGTDEADRLGTSDRDVELYPNSTKNENSSIPHEEGTFDVSKQHSHDQEGYLISPSNKQSSKLEEDEGDKEDVKDDEMTQEVSYPSGEETKQMQIPPQQENHLILSLCCGLFPSSSRSVWNGPHSLYPVVLSPAIRSNNLIKSALASVMNDVMHEC